MYGKKPVIICLILLRVIDLELKNILGKRIREERQKKGWSIEKLAEKIGLEPSSLGLVERAGRALSIEKLYTVA